MRIDCANPKCGNHVHSIKLKTGFAGLWEKHGHRWYCGHKCYFRVLADGFLADKVAGNHKTVRRVKLGLLLLKNNLVDKDTLEHALADQANSLKKIGEILVESGRITQKELKSALSMQAGVAVVTLAPDLKVKAKEHIPLSLLRAYPFVCCKFDAAEKVITLAVDDIDKMGPLEELFAAAYPGFLITFYITERDNLFSVLTHNYPGEHFRMEPVPQPVQRWRDDTQLEQLVYRMVDFLNANGAEEVDIESRGNGVQLKARLENKQISIAIHNDTPDQP